MEEAIRHINYLKLATSSLSILRSFENLCKQSALEGTNSSENRQHLSTTRRQHLSSNMRSYIKTRREAHTRLSCPIYIALEIWKYSVFSGN